MCMPVVVMIVAISRWCSRRIDVASDVFVHTLNRSQQDHIYLYPWKEKKKNVFQEKDTPRHVSRKRQTTADHEKKRHFQGYVSN